MEEERVQDVDGRSNQRPFIFNNLYRDRSEEEESSDLAAVGRESGNPFDQPSELWI